MKHLLYIHGFLSGPASSKACQTMAYLTHNEGWQVHCPALSSYPDIAERQLRQVIDSLPIQDLALVGSSLGGFWAKYWVQRYDLPAVLINPAVAPDKLLARYIGQSLTNYYSAETYVLTEQHAAFLHQCDAGDLTRPENLWVWLQTGDETLDYRQAAEYYAACRLHIEEGGNHSFTGFEARLPALLHFFADFWAKKGILRA
ncbi:MAG: YqiA/YcfP family alpha/beta fold hydrolase [Marinagarivorans sp.]